MPAVHHPRTAHIDNAGQPLAADVVARTRASLALLHAATRQAESLVDDLLHVPLVQLAVERRRAGAAGRARLAAPPGAAGSAAIELLSLPLEAWQAVLAALAPRQQRAALRRIVAASAGFAWTAPDRAHRLAACILHVVRAARLPRQAPLVRHQLAGYALLLRARALMTLRAHADALTTISEAYAAFPRGAAYDRDRMQAQLLRGHVLAATGHAADALQTLTACAQFAVEHVDPPALVDALASAAVLLCAHREYSVARCALALAIHVAARPGNEASLPALHASLAECAFLGYEAPRAS